MAGDCGTGLCSSTGMSPRRPGSAGRVCCARTHSVCSCVQSGGWNAGTGNDNVYTLYWGGMLGRVASKSCQGIAGQVQVLLWHFKTQPFFWYA